MTGHGPFCAPAIEIRSSPSDSTSGEANRRRKRLFRHHSIDGGAAQAGAAHDRGKAQKFDHRRIG